VCGRTDGPRQGCRTRPAALSVCSTGTRHVLLSAAKQLRFQAKPSAGRWGIVLPQLLSVGAAERLRDAPLYTFRLWAKTRFPVMEVRLHAASLSRAGRSVGRDHGLDVADVGQIALMILISLLVAPAAMAGRMGAAPLYFALITALSLFLCCK
jgi:hypothetical protein